jgi:hypothetical protein
VIGTQALSSDANSDGTKLGDFLLCLDFLRTSPRHGDAMVKSSSESHAFFSGQGLL